MRPGSTETLGLTLAAGFLAVFAGLLFVVTRVFRARGWEDVGTETRPIRSPAASRAAGAAFVVAGAWMMSMSWHDAHDRGSFFLKAAGGGPFFIGLGLWALIEAPTIPVERVTPMGWTLTGLGLATGMLYTLYLMNGGLPFLP